MQVLTLSARVCAGAVVALGTTVLAGWALDIAALKGVLPGLAMMKANTALSFVLSGAALALVSLRSSVIARRIGQGCAGIVLLVALLTLGEQLTAFDLGIDELLVRDPDTPRDLNPGRMASATSLGFVLAGLCISLSPFAARALAPARLARALAYAVLAIGSIGLLSYALDVEFLYASDAFGSVAVHTAAGFLALGAGLLAVAQAGTGAQLSEDARIETRVRERTAELNAANLRLRESEERLRLLISTTHQAAWDWDIVGHRLWHHEDLSAAAEGVVDSVEGAGARWFVHVHPEDRERIANRLEAVLAGDGRLWSEEYRYRKPDGSYAFALERGVIARDHEGRPLRMAGAMLDITARKQTEEEVRRLNEDLERRVLERTADLTAANQELETFSYSVSHDLRAPLRHIDGFTGLLAKHLDSSLDEAGRRYLAKISGSARQMGELIDDLLTFSHIGRTELKSARLDLSGLVQEVLRLLEPETAGREIEWIMSELPEAQGDPPLLRLVFQNLIGNALKYTRPRPQARIEIGVTREGAELIFSIRDNGVGFDMRYVDRLFGVFQRLHSGAEFEGTGIGLANVKRIVQRHGGRVWAEGAVGEGACFYFSLPDLA